MDHPLVTPESQKHPQGATVTDASADITDPSDTGIRTGVGTGAGWGQRAGTKPPISLFAPSTGLLLGAQLTARDQYTLGGGLICPQALH